MTFRKGAMTFARHARERRHVRRVVAESIAVVRVFDPVKQQNTHRRLKTVNEEVVNGILPIKGTLDRFQGRVKQKFTAKETKSECSSTTGKAALIYARREIDLLWRFSHKTLVRANIEGNSSSRLFRLVCLFCGATTSSAFAVSSQKNCEVDCRRVRKIAR